MKSLPFEYAVRNLSRSPSRFFLCLLGNCVVVMIVVASAALIGGMEKALLESGKENNVILIAAGSEESIERSEINSSVPSQAAASIRGIREVIGIQFVSPEIHAAMVVGLSQEKPAASQIMVRGVTPPAFLVHPQARIVKGRIFDPGEDELVVGASTATRLGVPEAQLDIGETLWMDDRPWKIVGHFEAPRTIMNAEIWCSLNNLRIVTRRDSLSCVVITMADNDVGDAETFAATRLDLELIAMRESEYYQRLSQFYNPIRMLIWITAGLFALGGVFGGLNIMYAAFISRIREIGMLRSLGFSRSAIILCFVQESLLVAGTGTLIGIGIAQLAFDNVAFRLSTNAFSLNIDAGAIAGGIAAGALIGLFGAISPALQCLRTPIPDALKAI